jgi:peptidoglycan/LPS O-acetylase OafA/YrhL
VARVEVLPMSHTDGPSAAFGQRIRTIDFFRGIGALLIVATHAAHLPSNWRHASPSTFAVGVVLIPLGHMALSMFLLMSGYCIHANTLRHSPAGEVRCDVKRFWKRRFWRLYPPYAIVVILSAAVTLGLFLRQGIPWVDAVKGVVIDTALHAVMVHNFMSAYATGLYNGALWTLGVEEQLYILYFLFLALRARSMRAALLGAFVVSGVLWTTWTVAAPAALGEGRFRLGVWYWWPFRFWFLWALGALAAEAHAGRVLLPRWCYDVRVGLVLLTFSVIYQPWVWQPLTGTTSLSDALHELLDLPGESAPLAMRIVLRILLAPTQPLAFLIFLNACIRYEARPDTFRHWGMRAGVQLGVVSYSLYLTHMPFLSVLEARWPSRSFVGAVCYTPLCLLAAWGFFLAFERPFLSAGRSPGARPQPAPQVDASRPVHRRAA